MKSKDVSDQWLMDARVLRFGAESEAPVSESEHWLVTLAGPMSVLHGDFLDSVATGHSPQLLQRRLQQTAGITDRASFEGAANWFVQEGDRRTYRVLWRLALRAQTRSKPSMVQQVLEQAAPVLVKSRTAYSQADYELVAQRLSLQPREVRGKLDAARGWLPLLQRELGVTPESVGDLVAWDAARLVGITRWAVGAGYIGRDEFEKFASGLADRAKSAYRKWIDFSAAYVVGGLLWNAAPVRQVQVISSVGMLNAHPRSPFTRIPRPLAAVEDAPVGHSIT